MRFILIHRQLPTATSGCGMGDSQGCEEDAMQTVFATTGNLTAFRPSVHWPSLPARESGSTLKTARPTIRSSGRNPQT